MTLAAGCEIALDLWTPCYPGHEMQVQFDSNGLRVTSIPLTAAYAIRYPLLKARTAQTLDIEVRYRAEVGDLTFGALSGDESRWLATTGPAREERGALVKTFQLTLGQHEKFVLLAANSSPVEGQASTCVIEQVWMSGVVGDDLIFSGPTDDSRHHPIFLQYPCPHVAVPANASAYFVGAIVRNVLFTGHESSTPARTIQPDYPPFDNEYFEWVALLLGACAAEGTFTMVELGAGYGRWSLMAAGAARRRGLPFKLVSVEAEPTHFKWMEMCFVDNGLDPKDHLLLEAAVSTTTDDVWFHVGHASDWYGQHIALPSEMPGQIGYTDPSTGRTMRRVRAITLAGLLDSLDYVDVIDIDIQGAEAEVLQASVQQLHAKVGVVSVGTHVNPVNYGLDIHNAVTKLFTDMKWVNLFLYQPGVTTDTPYGPIEFDDGVQVWVNPKATRVLELAGR